MTIVPYGELRGALARQSNPSTDIQNEYVDGRVGPVTPPATPVRPAGRVPSIPSTYSWVSEGIEALCQLRSISPTRFRSLITASPFDIIGPVRRARENVWQNLCGETDAGNPVIAPPFVGGGCDGVRYDVTAIMERFTGVGTCTQSTQTTQTVRFWGPIAQVRFDPVNSSISGSCAVISRGLASQPIQPLGVKTNFFAIASSEGCPAPYVSSAVITRVDGMPDNCGSPLPQIPDNTANEPPLPPQLSIDIQLGDGNTYNIPIENISFDNDLQFSIGDLDISFDGVNFDIDFGGNGSGVPSLPFPTDCPPCNGGQPEIDPDPDDVIPAPPGGDDPATMEPLEPDPDQVIRGVLVTVSAISPAEGVVYQEENPDVIIPDAGLVSFRIRATSGSTGWTPDIKVKNRRCFIECTWPLGAIDVRGTPRNGVTWVLTPIREAVAAPA